MDEHERTMRRMMGKMSVAQVAIFIIDHLELVRVAPQEVELRSVCPGDGMGKRRSSIVISARWIASIRDWRGGGRPDENCIDRFQSPDCSYLWRLDQPGGRSFPGEGGQTVCCLV